MSADIWDEDWPGFVFVRERFCGLTGMEIEDTPLLPPSLGTMCDEITMDYADQHVDANSLRVNYPPLW